MSTPETIHKTDIFVCQCHSMEHQVNFFHSDDLLYVYIHLNNRGFFHRLKRGLRYIFGYSSRFGEWDEFIFKLEDEDKLREFLIKLKRERDGDDLP